MEEELRLTNEKILKLERLIEKMEEDGNYNAGAYEELDELYAKREELQNMIDN